MDVVLYQEALYSFGERQHAASFAAQIRDAGYRPRFVVAEAIAEETRRAGFDPVVFTGAEQGLAIVRDLAPALVVGCELFNLSADTIDALARLGPIATLDGTSLGLQIRTDPFETAEFRQPLPLPDEYLSFRACPVGDLEADSASVFHWPLFAESVRMPKDARRYADLGLDAARKTVLLPIAPWAQHFAGLGGDTFAGLEGYYERLVARIVDGLAASGEPVQLVIVARREPAWQTRSPVEVRFTGLVHYDLYDHLSRSCDVIVSDNIIQASLVRAFVMETPHLVLQNTTPTEIPYPYNIFPLRQRLPIERAFSQAVEVAEFSDASQIRERLAAVVRSGHSDADRRDRRREYLARWKRLPGAGRILERTIGPARG